MRSDPDAQRAAAGLSAIGREGPEWLIHRAAGLLADRDPIDALMLLEPVPAEWLPMAGLRDYVQAAAEQQR